MMMRCSRMAKRLESAAVVVAATVSVGIGNVLSKTRTYLHKDLSALALTVRQVEKR